MQLFNHDREIPLNQIVIAKYLSNTLKMERVNQYVETHDSSKLTINLVKILVSDRDGRYHLVRGIEELMALKILGVDSVRARVIAFNSAKEEEMLCRAINGLNANNTVNRFNYFIPNITNDNILTFCNSIVLNTIPDYVTVRPEIGCLGNKCFTNVEKKIKSSGGRKQCGWIIAQQANAFLTAICHAVWISDIGERIDITPSGYEKILFLADDSLPPEGYRIDNHYMALSKSPFIDEYIYFDKELGRILPGYEDSKGQFDDAQNTTINYAISRHLEYNHLFNLKVERNDPCPCQSGMKYKKCCGRQ